MAVGLFAQEERRARGLTGGFLSVLSARFNCMAYGDAIYRIASLWSTFAADSDAVILQHPTCQEFHACFGILRKLEKSVNLKNSSYQRDIPQTISCLHHSSDQQYESEYE
jgi:hypothetical protein